MSVQGMNHFTVLSDDLETTRKFYCDLLGFEVGDQPILHVIHRNQLQEHRAGVIDHMAFSASGLKATLAALDARRIEYVCRQQKGTGTWQVFVHDPNGAKVELDFDADEPAPAR